MAYRIAGIDVHKRMLAVAGSDVEVVGEFVFERRQFGSTPAQLRVLAEWLVEQQGNEVVMESTAQYWKPVWAALERSWQPLAQQRDGAARRTGTLHLAQAQSNRARPGRKRDFADAERLVKRLVANELTLSFVPDPEQRLWRTLTRTKYQLTRTRPTPESAGGVARRGPDQVVQPGVGPAGRERAADAARAGRRGD
jgi:transposase